MGKFSDLATRIQGSNMLALEKLRLHIVTSLKEADAEIKNLEETIERLEDSILVMGEI